MVTGEQLRPIYQIIAWEEIFPVFLFQSSGTADPDTLWMYNHLIVLIICLEVSAKWRISNNIWSCFE